jgi:hypothetical protein
MNKNIEKDWLYGGSFVIISSLIQIVIYSYLRINLELPIKLFVIILLILSASFLGPITILNFFKLKDNDKEYFYPLISVLIIFSTSFFVIINKFYLTVYLILVLSSFIYIKSFAKLFGFNKIIKLILICLFFNLLLFFLIFNTNHAHVFSPEQAMLGIINHDTQFHSAIAGIIKNTGVPTLGVDGYNIIKYHYFYHFILAGFSAASNTQPILVISILQLSMLIPLFIFLLYFAVRFLLKFKGEAQNTLFIIIFTLLLMMNVAGPFSKTHFISETYLVSLLTLFAIYPLIYKWNKSKEFYDQNYITFFLVLIIPIFFSMKVSTGLAFSFFLVWTIFKKEFFNKKSILFFLLILIQLYISKKLFTPKILDYVVAEKYFNIFYFFKEFPNVYSLSSIVIIISLYILTKYNFRNFLSNRKDSFIESIFLMSIFGLIMCIIGIPQSSSVWYIFNTPQWFAVPLFLSLLIKKNKEIHKFYMNFNKKIVGKAITTVTAYILLTVIVDGSLKFEITKNIIKPLYENNKDELQKSDSAGNYFKNNIATNYTLFDESFAKNLKNSIGYKISSLGKDINLDRKTAIFIPPEEREFWDFRLRCRDKHHAVPSMIGVATLYGSPPKEYNCKNSDYTIVFGVKTYSRIIANDLLCEHARNKNINNVIILTNLSKTKQININKIDCKL